MKIKKLQDMNWNNPIIDYFREKSNIEKFYIRDSKHAEKSAKHYLKIRKKDQPLSEYGKDVVTAIVHALWALSILDKKTRESFFLSRRLKRLQRYYSRITGETWQRYRQQQV